MPGIDIEGVGTVDVDDAFLSLSPEDQARTVDEIAAAARGGSGTGSPVAPVNIGRGEAAGRGAADMATVGFYDELRGLAEAGGAGERDPMSLGAVLKGGYRRWQDDPEAEARYAAAKGRASGDLDEAYREHPVSTLAGGIGGALATAPMMPFTGGTAAAGTMGRLGQAMGAGAVAGGAYEFGSGEGGAIERGLDVPLGMLKGAAGGVVGEVAGAGIRRGVQAWRGAPRVAPPPLRPGTALTPAARPGPMDAFAGSRLSSPEAALANQRIAQAAEFDIPLTRGQAGGNASQIGFEEAARNYAKGQIAGDRLTNFDQAQRSAVEAGAGNLARSFSPGGNQVAESAVDAGGMLADRVRSAAQSSRRGYQSAYRDAGKAGGAFKTEAVQGVGFGVRMGLENADNPVIVDKLTPRASQALDIIDDLDNLKIRNDAAVPSRGVMPTGQTTRIAGVSVSGIEQVRKNLNALYKATEISLRMGSRYPCHADARKVWP